MTMHAVTAICSVIFHLRDGQKIEACVPEGALSDAEASAIAFLALPDSLNPLELTAPGSVRDTTFRFRIPRSENQQSKSASAASLHGFVFCRQRRDDRLPRAGEQRAIVVLSLLPLNSIMDPLVRYAGPLVLSRGVEALKQVFDKTAAWPPLLQWGGIADFHTGFGALQVELPCLSTLPPDGLVAATALSLEVQEEDSNSIDEALLAGLDIETGMPLCCLPPLSSTAAGQREDPLIISPNADADLFTPLASVLPHLWTLWEMMLLGEPLLAISPSPAASCAAVIALTSLLSPMPCFGDYRPYFCVHDHVFHTLAATQGPAPGMPTLVGVTNPQILKALCKWPNVLASGYTIATQDPGTAPRFNSTDDESNKNTNFNNKPQSAASNTTSTSTNSNSGGGLLQRVVRAPLGSLLRRGSAATPAAKALEAVQSGRDDGIWLSYQPLTRQADEVLADLRLPKSGEVGALKRHRLAHINTDILRRHFQQLTLALLQPLLAYITPTAPPVRATAEELITPPPLPLVPHGEVFARDIRSGKVDVPDILLRRFRSSRKYLAEFYLRLLTESPHLRAWLQLRRQAADVWQRTAWRSAWRAVGGAVHFPGVKNTTDVASVESFLAAEAQLKAAMNSSSSKKDGEDEDVIRQLEQLREIFASLPRDLQDILVLTPKRAELLAVADD